MSYQKAITDAITGITIFVPLDADELAELNAKVAANAAQAAVDAQKADDESKVIDALPTKLEVTNTKDVASLAAQVAKQGELLALIAAKLGLV